MDLRENTRELHCYRCEREAVERCYTCGALFCEQHGDINCERCDTAIAPGDCRPDRITATPRASAPRAAWWRPQAAEDFTPPACYQCKGLARRVCRHCHNRYCSDHAGGDGLCASCVNSSWLGVFVLVGTFIVMALLVMIGYLNR